MKLSAIFFILLFTACFAQATDNPKHSLIDYDDFIAKVTDGATVIDVRRISEFTAGHVEHALHIDVSGNDFRERVRQLDRDTTYVVYCRTHNRSAHAVSIMKELGFQHVYYLRGGILTLQNHQHPLIRIAE